MYGAGGETAWQGRLTATPRVSGDQLSISPAAVGWQAALVDDQSARMIYIDCDLTSWQPASAQRKINLASVGFDTADPTVLTDSTGQPALDTGINGTWSRGAASDAWYGQGLDIATIYYAWKLNGNVGPTDTDYAWSVNLSSDNVATSTDTSGNLRAAGPGTGSVPATTGRPFSMLEFSYAIGGGGAANVHYAALWTYLGIVGMHGLTIRGTLTGGSTGPPLVLAGGLGVLASDVVQHAVQTWAPELATTRAGQSTIEPTTFVIPQLAFTDPTTASNIITTALQYELRDWWVDEGPTFNEAQRDNHGRDWRARVGPSGLQETGPQVDTIVNNVSVADNDVTGATRTVGTPGTGANTIDASLADTDPSNPATAAGLTVYPASFPEHRDILHRRCRDQNRAGIPVLAKA